MEQEELWKLSNDETIIIKPADKGRAVVILSKDHYQSMINIHWMKWLQKLNPCINSKIQSNLSRFLR